MAVVPAAIPDAFDEIVDEMPAVGAAHRTLDEDQPPRRLRVNDARRLDRVGVHVCGQVHGPGATIRLVQHVETQHVPPVLVAVGQASQSTVRVVEGVLGIKEEAWLPRGILPLLLWSIAVWI